MHDHPGSVRAHPLRSRVHVSQVRPSNASLSYLSRHRRSTTKIIRQRLTTLVPIPSLVISLFLFHPTLACAMWIAVSPSTPCALTPSTPARAPSRRGAVQAIRNVARASTSSSFLVLSDDESLAHSCARAVKTSADARVIIVITESSTESRETVRVERRGPDAYALVASGEDAATCAADPTEGLLAKLGARIGLAIVATREACLGEDGETKAAMRAARRVAVCGAPVVLFSAPRGNGKREGADDETRCESLNSLVSELVLNVFRRLCSAEFTAVALSVSNALSMGSARDNAARVR